MQVLIIPVVKVMIVMAAGFVLARQISIDQKTISRLALYAFVPALVLRSLYRANANPLELLGITGTYLLFMVTLFLLAVVLSRFLKLNRAERSPFILSAAIGNLGNFGIPIVIFALGEQAGITAVLIHVLNVIMINTVGVYIASRGSEVRWSDSLQNVLKMPVLYAAVVGLVLNFSGIVLPAVLSESVDILASAAVPLMLIFLGGQLVNMHKLYRTGLLLWGGALKLIVAPVLAALLVNFILKLPAAFAQVFILQMAMPTAVNINILAIEFGSDVEIASSITFLTTLLSLVTIPLVIFVFLS